MGEEAGGAAVPTALGKEHTDAEPFLRRANACSVETPSWATPSHVMLHSAEGGGAGGVAATGLRRHSEGEARLDRTAIACASETCSEGFSSASQATLHSAELWSTRGSEAPPGSSGAASTAGSLLASRVSLASTADSAGLESPAPAPWPLGTASRV